MNLFGKPKKEEIISASFQILMTFIKAYDFGYTLCVYNTVIYKQQSFLLLSHCFARQNSLFS